MWIVKEMQRAKQTKKTKGLTQLSKQEEPTPFTKTSTEQ